MNRNRIVWLTLCLCLSSLPVCAQSSLLFEYDADDGRFSFQTDGALTTLQIESESRLFTGPRPERLFLPPFDVYSRGLMFLLRPVDGLGSTDFGPVMAAGLSHEQIAEDLCVTGSWLPAGRVESAFLSTPGGEPLSLICRDDPVITDGFVLEYEPNNGAMAFRYEGDPVVAATSLVIDSRADLFTGARPSLLDGQFDLFRTDRIFRFDNEGFSSLTLGEVATLDVPVDRVVSDLCVAGSLLGGGAVEDVRLNDRNGPVLPTCRTAPPTTGGPSVGSGGGGIAVGPGPFDVSFFYDASTGGFSIDSPSLLTTLEIVASEPVFTGPMPTQILPPFDVYEPLKMFVIRPDGFANEDFGAIFPAGLQTETLASLLTVNGSLWPTGSIGTVGFVIPEPTSCWHFLLPLTAIRRLRSAYMIRRTPPSSARS